MDVLEMYSEYIGKWLSRPMVFGRLVHVWMGLKNELQPGFETWHKRTLPVSSNRACASSLRLVAIHGCTATIADTKNAFQQSPSPTEASYYLAVDDAIQSWYLKRFGIKLDPKTDVIPLQKALQGHPEAGRLWETMITGILLEFGFKSTTHERNLYRGEIDGQMVLVCGQVDDFAVSTVDPATASKLDSMINTKMTTVDKGIGAITINGAFSQYNGVDIHQTRDYIKLLCESYINRVLQTHG
jgi:hypothetical protein